MKKTIDKIVGKYIKVLEDDPRLISIFLVGSMSSPDYQEKDLNDYDIRFIVKEMDLEIYSKIKYILNLIQKEIELAGIGCVISNVIGPAKMEPKQAKNVLLHALVMSEKELEELANIHKYSYSTNYTHLYGTDLIDKYKSIKLTAEDVVYSIEGIDFCTNLLKERTSSYSEWVEKDGNLTLERKTFPASKSDVLELVYYSCHKAISNIQNMIKTNNSDIKIEDYIELSDEEKELIERINTNQLKVNDIDDNLISSVQRILLKLSKTCISIFDKIKKPKKKYFNSLEWGIIDSDSRTIRGDGFDYLKELRLPTGNNFSMSFNEYLEKKDAIQKEISLSNYLVIFEPPNNTYKRYGLNNINSTEMIDEFIEHDKPGINQYHISFIEKIIETDKSYVGAVMSDGKGSVVIETLSGTCDSRELTSRGADPKRIAQYIFTSFHDKVWGIPRDIAEVRDICQYFKGYYEFAHGRVRNEEQIYFTFYSSNEHYTNIFKGGKQLCKSITK